VVARSSGIVVIAAACLVLAAMAAVRNLTVSGLPAMPAGVVVPGVCIASPGSPFDHPVTPGAGEGEQNWETATYAYPVATVVDCARPHAGEVFSVDYDANVPTSATLPQLDDRDASCQKKVDAELAQRGLTQIIDRRPSGMIAWKPAVDLTGRAVGPDGRARRGGERWSACARVSDVDTVGDPGGRLPGQCLASGDVIDLNSIWAAGGVVHAGPEVGVSCSVPHPAQLVAYAAMTGGDLTEQDILESCVSAVQRFTGLTAADLDQGLTITTTFTDYPYCVVRVSGAELLAGSLLGNGDRPVPWAR
jgi:hypothetical protein